MIENESRAEETDWYQDQFRKAVVIKDRNHHFVCYKKCFVGSETVTNMVNMGLAKDREHAVSIGNGLLAAGFFAHVEKSYDFRDEPLFYRFAEDELELSGSRIGARGVIWGGSDTVPTNSSYDLLPLFVDGRFNAYDPYFIQALEYCPTEHLCRNLPLIARAALHTPIHMSEHVRVVVGVLMARCQREPMLSTVMCCFRQSNCLPDLQLENPVMALYWSQSKECGLAAAMCRIRVEQGTRFFFDAEERSKSDEGDLPIYFPFYAGAAVVEIQVRKVFASNAKPVLLLFRLQQTSSVSVSSLSCSSCSISSSSSSSSSTSSSSFISSSSSFAASTSPISFESASSLITPCAASSSSASRSFMSSSFSSASLISMLPPTPSSSSSSSTTTATPALTPTNSTPSATNTANTVISPLLTTVSSPPPPLVISSSSSCLPSVREEEESLASTPSHRGDKPAIHSRLWSGFKNTTSNALGGVWGGAPKLVGGVLSQATSVVSGAAVAATSAITLLNEQQEDDQEQEMCAITTSSSSSVSVSTSSSSTVIVATTTVATSISDISTVNIDNATTVRSSTTTTPTVITTAAALPAQTSPSLSPRLSLSSQSGPRSLLADALASAAAVATASSSSSSLPVVASSTTTTASSFRPTTVCTTNPLSPSSVLSASLASSLPSPSACSSSSRGRQDSFASPLPSPTDSSYSSLSFLPEEPDSVSFHMPPEGGGESSFINSLIKSKEKCFFRTGRGYKKGFWNTAWQLRFLALTQDKLEWYADLTCFCRGEKPKSCVELSSDMQCVLADDCVNGVVSSEGKEVLGGFNLKAASRCYYFCSPHAQAWVTAINQVIHKTWKPSPVGHQFYAILKKGDDPRQDLGILRLFAVFNVMWARESVCGEFNLPVVALTYNVLPIQVDLELIQFVDRLIPLRQVIQFAGQFCEKGLHRLITTAAGAFTAGFVLGIRDRHDENIVICKDDGSLFNIDFGNILGDTPSIDTSEFAITNGFKEIIGSLWDNFVDLCIDAFLALRKHISMVVGLAYVMLSATHSSTDVALFVRKQLRMDISEEAAIADLRKLIRPAKRTTVKNSLHSVAQALKT